MIAAYHLFLIWILPIHSPSHFPSPSLLRSFSPPFNLPGLPNLFYSLLLSPSTPPSTLPFDLFLPPLLSAYPSLPPLLSSSTLPLLTITLCPGTFRNGLPRGGKHLPHPTAVHVRGFAHVSACTCILGVTCIAVPASTLGCTQQFISVWSTCVRVLHCLSFALDTVHTVPTGCRLGGIINMYD